jgi:uncharacterized Zn-finger protein
MSSLENPSQAGAAVVIVAEKDLHGPGVVFCPNPKMPLWSSHPKVYIDVSHGEGRCAYCGTVYRLAPGTVLSAHH